MKKLLTLLLVLVLALGLAAPALAFTSDDTEDDDMPYELSIYLVEYDDNDFFGIASLPMSDRGYAKNEIVAAVVELYVPEDETVQWPDNIYLILGGENVDLDVTDNTGGLPLPTLQASFENGPDAVAVPMWNPADATDHDEIFVQTVYLPGEETYKWLFFAKVTDDEASLTAKLKDGSIPDLEFPEGDGGISIILDDIQYNIAKDVNYMGTDDIQYLINIVGGDYAGALIWIDADKDNKSTGMTIYSPDNGGVRGILGVNTDGELGVARESNPAVLLTDGDFYDNVMDVYNDVVVDVFGLDYFKIGNYVRDSFFEDLVSPRTLIATVDIEPWTAYVSVPDNIVMDPPKTGDAASIMGFVMVALSGAGAIALKKRG